MFPAGRDGICTGVAVTNVPLYLRIQTAAVPLRYISSHLPAEIGLPVSSSSGGAQASRMPLAAPVICIFYSRF